MRCWRICALVFLSGLLLLPAPGSYPAPARADDGFRYFAATDRAVSGLFYIYWQAHGGLAQQGLPLSDEFSEVSTQDHRPYRVQYFERAVFEYHPEYQGTDAAVLLSLLGVAEYQRRYGVAGAPSQHASTVNPRLFPQTGMTVGGKFRAYWESHGGLAQQGYPISNEFTEVSTLDGQSHTVQYFERAVFELHPEYAGTPYEVELAQLGTYRYQDRYPRTALVPPLPGHEQLAPLGSDTYLVWAERSLSLPVTVAVRALNLATGQVQLVTDHTRDQNAVALSGSRVVWIDDTNCPPGACRSNAILGKDLATGQTYTVADGPAIRDTPSIAGTTVVWTETEMDQFRNPSGGRFFTKDLATGAVTSLPLPSTGAGVFSPQVSAEYIAWVEIEDGGRSLIRAYNRQTGQTQMVAEEQMQPGYAPHLALAGHYLVWGATHLNLANLQTQFSSVLAQNPALAPAISGETVVWSDTGSDNNPDIWGLTLTDARPRVLAQGEGNQWQPTVAGDRLVWANERGPNHGLLSAVPLAAALAGTLP